MTYQGFLNTTPLTAGMFVMPDETGAMTLVVIAKATYRIHAGRAPRLPHESTGLAFADEQEPILTAATHTGEPGSSSLRREHEVVIDKPLVDVVLLGHAYPEHARDTSVDVTLRAGPLRKTVRAFGARKWKSALGPPKLSAPAPIDRVPLTFERAYGGWDRRAESPEDHRCDPRNPVGVGFFEIDPARGNVAFEGLDGALAPDLEDPARPIKSILDRPAPVAFGFVAPSWAPRQRLAGTFDEAWRASRFPLPPADFQRAHHNAAPADQQVRDLPAGAPVEIANVSPSGPLAFDLPRFALAGSVLVDGKESAAPMRLDTLVIDADAMRVHTVLRASFRVHRKLHDLSWARLGDAKDVSPRAEMKGAAR
ncbi:MAG: DUF2169 domain-containing protein [Polyangiaceae bacterium]